MFTKYRYYTADVESLFFTNELQKQGACVESCNCGEISRIGRLLTVYSMSKTRH